MKISVVSTLYYSAPYLEEFHRRVTASLKRITSDYEIVFVNDGSPDDALEVALALKVQDDHIRIVDLARNFGHHRAMMTGLMHVQGDLVYLIDCDLEEPPEALYELHHKMQQENADVVYGTQKYRDKQPFLYRILSNLYYWIIHYVIELPLPRNLMTIRLMTRRYVDALVQHEERVFVIAGLWSITGFKQVSHDLDKSYKGTTTYNLRRRANVAIYSIIAFSNKPLIYIAVLGFLMTASAMTYIAGVLLQILFFTGVGVDGWSSLMLSIWFFSGLIIFVLGIIAMYISVIFTEVKQRPYTVIRTIHENDADYTHPAPKQKPEQHHKVPENA